LAAVVIVVLLGAQLRIGRESAARRVGVGVDQRPEGLVVTGVVPGLPADKAGVHKDDVIVRVNGAQVRDLLQYDEAARGFAAERPVSLEVRRGGKPQALEVVPGTPFGWGDYLLGLAATLGFLAVGLLAQLQRAGELRSRLLFLFSAAVAVELALPTSQIGFPSLDLVKVATFYILTGLQIGLELHLASVLPERQRWLSRAPWAVPLFYVVGALVAGGTVAAMLVENFSGQHVLPWTFSTAETFVNNVCLPVWATAVMLLIAVQARRFPEARGRHQATLVLLGVVPWVAIVYATSALSWLGIDRPDWVDSLWAPLLLCYPVAVFVAIYRYHLFDLELVLRRGLLYGTLTGALVLGFYTALGAGSVLVSALIGGSRRSVWVVAGATLVLGLAFTPLRQFLQRWIDRRFFPEREALRNRLIDLAASLPAQGNVPAMARYLVGEISRSFAAARVTLLIADPGTGVLAALAATHVNCEEEFDQSFLLSPDDAGVRMLAGAGRPFFRAAIRGTALAQRLEFFGADLAVPLLANRKLVGILLVGEKQNAARFPAEELELLGLLSHHAATVFENARLYESATFETLTGLMRREAVLDRLAGEVERARRYQRPLTVGMADLDYFKGINDEFGHLTGDAMLRKVSQALIAGLRSSDWVGRYGGEEFLFVLPETTLDASLAVAEKVRSMVEQARLAVPDGRRIKVTVSIGLASLADLPARLMPSVEGLIALADRRLMRAKAAGRNRIELSTDPGS
jgi:diguanylate cyclase (GGDEF)-like protein